MLMLAGCAAEQQVNAAQRAVDSAKGVHADVLSAYEYYSAEAYLTQAIAQLHESDFDAASTYANKARAQATLAEQKAREAYAKPMIPWVVAHPEGATTAAPPPVAPPPAAVGTKPPAPPAPPPAAVGKKQAATPTPTPKPGAPAKPMTPATSTAPIKAGTPPAKTPAAAAPPAATPVPPPPKPPPPKPKKKTSDEYPLGEPDEEPTPVPAQ
jgi:hypothetical protein